MGADIHMFIEYRNKEQAKRLEKEGRKSYWWSFGDHLNPGRNYTMFAILAGVRGDYPESFDWSLREWAIHGQDIYPAGPVRQASTDFLRIRQQNRGYG